MEHSIAEPQVIAEHIEEFGIEPEVIVSAPARIHLAGDHSAFFQDKTLSMAIDLPVYVAVSTRNDFALRFCFPAMKERKRGVVGSVKFRKEDRWANAIKAELYGIGDVFKDSTGLNFSVHSVLPPYIGLGITSAIKCASALALCKYYHLAATGNRLMQIIQKGNQEFLSSATHFADINTVLFSKKNSCVLTDHETGEYKILPFKFKDVSVVITDARVPRINVWSENFLQTDENFNLLKSLKIRKNEDWDYENSDIEINDVLESLNDDMRRRLMYIIREHRFVKEAGDALAAGNFSLFARNVNKSQESLRDLYQLSCPEIDWLIKRVLESDINSSRNPSVCSRLTGKGFGRCTFSMMPKDEVENYVQKLSDYERIFGFKPAYYVVSPSAGISNSR